MKRLMFVGLGAAVLAGGLSEVSFAQRDAGAKARGEIGTGFWNSGGGRAYSGPSFQYQPGPVQSYRSYSYTPAESYRSFSYEPVGIAPGDTVVVSADTARVMSGPEQVGTLPEGHTFRVTRVVNGWLGVVTEADGEQVRGWIWNDQVAREGRSAGEAPAPGAQSAAPSPVYRRFSYEPTDQQTYQPAYVPPTRGFVQPQEPSRRTSPPEARLRPGSRRY